MHGPAPRRARRLPHLPPLSGRPPSRLLAPCPTTSLPVPRPIPPIPQSTGALTSHLPPKVPRDSSRLASTRLPPSSPLGPSPTLAPADLPPFSLTRTLKPPPSLAFYRSLLASSARHQSSSPPAPALLSNHCLHKPPAALAYSLPLLHVFHIRLLSTFSLAPSCPSPVTPSPPPSLPPFCPCLPPSLILHGLPLSAFSQFLHSRGCRLPSLPLSLPA